jgi:hypothetical protein
LSLEPSIAPNLEVALFGYNLLHRAIDALMQIKCGIDGANLPVAAGRI